METEACCAEADSRGDEGTLRGAAVRWDKIDYLDTDQWGSFKAQQKLHFKAVFHAVH